MAAIARLSGRRSRGRKWVRGVSLLCLTAPRLTSNRGAPEIPGVGPEGNHQGVQVPQLVHVVKLNRGWLAEPRPCRACHRFWACHWINCKSVFFDKIACTGIDKRALSWYNRPDADPLRAPKERSLWRVRLPHAGLPCRPAGIRRGLGHRSCIPWQRVRLWKSPNVLTNT